MGMILAEIFNKGEIEHRAVLMFVFLYSDFSSDSRKNWFFVHIYVSLVVKLITPGKV